MHIAINVYTSTPKDMLETYSTLWGSYVTTGQYAKYKNNIVCVFLTGLWWVSAPPQTMCLWVWECNGETVA